MFSFFSLQSADVHGAAALHPDPGLGRTDTHSEVKNCVVCLGLKHVLNIRLPPRFTHSRRADNALCMFVLLFFLCSKYESVAVNTCLVLMVGGALVAAL